MHSLLTASLMIGLILLGGCGGGSADDATTEVVASHLEIPWALAIAPDGRFFITERPGRIWRMPDRRSKPVLFAELSVAHVGEGGLLGLALHPAFQENGLLYVYHTYAADAGLRNRVVRLRDEGGRGVDAQILLDGIPGAAIHDGGRLKFGPDGKLYISAGEAAVPELAQDLSSLGGKILRLNPDGSIPADNPFPGSPIYSFGHRNPQGLAWHPDTGDLFATEHGPSGEFGLCCRDEVNRIIAGGNYGWPRVAGRGGDARFIDPIHESGQGTWAPSGATFLTRQPGRGHLLFAALRGQHLQRVELGGSRFDQVVRVQQLLAGQFGRLRDVVEDPDGEVYILTNNRDGRGQPAVDDDRLLRLLPSALQP